MASRFADDLFSTNRIPHIEEQEELRSFLSEYDSRKSVITQRMLQLEREMAALSEERAGIDNITAPIRLVLAPFRFLPDDILREIFIACLDPGTIPTMSNKTAPILLTQITSRTREIALSTPSLWNAIHVPIFEAAEDPNGRESRIMEQRAIGVKEWLARSGALPLTISVADSYRVIGDVADRHITSIIVTIVTFCKRWRDLSLLSFMGNHLEPIISLTAPDVPLLQSFHHLVQSSNGMGEGRFPNLAQPKFLAAPTLRRYAAVGTMSTEVTVQLAKTPVHWGNLTHLNLPVNMHTECMLILETILRQTSRLENLHIVVQDQGGLKSTNTGDIPLPFLKFLHISDKTKMNQTIINIPELLLKLDTPVLKTLVYLYFRFKNETISPSLDNILERSLNITELAIGYPFDIADLTSVLRRLPFLKTLYMLSKRYESISTDVGTFLEQFVSSDQDQILCPALEEFHITGDPIHIPSQSLRLFLLQKLGQSPNGLPWKALTMALYHPVEDVHICEELAAAFRPHRVRVKFICQEAKYITEPLYKLNNGLGSVETVANWSPITNGLTQIPSVASKPRSERFYKKLDRQWPVQCRFWPYG